MNQQLIADRTNDEAIESLLGLARNGSIEALGDLFEMTREHLLHAASHELPMDLRAKQGASDLVQETFLVAHRLFHRFEGRTSAELLLWLKAILRNTSAHLRRSYRTARRAAFREVPMDAASSLTADLSASDSTPSALIQREETATMLRAATERLPARDRQVLLLKHHDELTFEEVGQRLAISTVAARKAWLRAIERLREQLELEQV
ncbi:sigma-70 family RNA polymerase sigma factor [Paludisphaera borealis]|uniref:RNA polymerase sigma factor FliA n=1 Tax=Paludisphaera borealis TaxID=1387353 RepID=A0A1U7CXF3_9BACT|nr:sigma-70 family RNA polymerase sigma factor [Paludisphaera borealis]APW63601.1 RNA polymerase sigma factor FliA [Paludisphaera borealis]